MTNQNYRTVKENLSKMGNSTGSISLPDFKTPLRNWRFWTIPNMLSILRLLLLIPTVWTLILGLNLISFILFVISSLTDPVDGFIARRFNQESEWGKILDPIADKLTLNILVIILAIQSRIPIFLAVIVVGRDLVILAGSLVLMKSKTFIPPSNWAGKVTGVAFFALLCAGILNVRWLLEMFLEPVITDLIFITVVVYTYTFILQLKFKHKEEDDANPCDL